MSSKASKSNEPPEAAFLGMPEKVTELLKTESDRGAILILVAYIEEVLGFIVRAACVSNDDADSLLQIRRPAGDFDSRIRLCKAFALIHPDEARALRAVQKIRNSAAHFDRKGRGFDVLFDSHVTGNQVANLCEALNLQLNSREPDAVRANFIMASRLLATRMWFRLCEARRPQPAPTVKEIANSIREQMKDTPTAQVISAAEQKFKDGDPELMMELMKAIKESLHEALQQRKAEAKPKSTGSEEVSG